MNNENHEKLLRLTFRMKIFQYVSSRKLLRMYVYIGMDGCGWVWVCVCVCVYFGENERASKTHFSLYNQNENLQRIIMSFIPIEFTCIRWVLCFVCLFVWFKFLFATKSCEMYHFSLHNFAWGLISKNAFLINVCGRNFIMKLTQCNNNGCLFFVNHPIFPQLYTIHATHTRVSSRFSVSNLFVRLPLSLFLSLARFFSSHRQAMSNERIFS